MFATLAEEARVRGDAAQQALESIQALKVHAKRWDGLRSERTQLEEKLAKADQALHNLLPGLPSWRPDSAQLVSAEMLEAIEKQKVQALQEADRLKELEIALPWMRQFDQARRLWREATTRAATAEKEAKKLTEQIANLEQGVDGAETEATSARESVGQLQIGVTEATTNLRQAKARIARFHEIDKKPLCDYCGQPLKPEHLEEERARIERELEAARSIEQLHIEEHRHALIREREAADELQKLQQFLIENKEQLQSELQRHERARDDQDRAKELALSALESLTPLYRARIASPGSDITSCFSSEFPDAQELNAFTGEVSQRLEWQRRGEILNGLIEALHRKQSDEGRLQHILQEIDAIPEEARRSLTQIEAIERDARVTRQQAERDWTEAEKKRQELEFQRQRRKELERERLKAAGEEALYKELARLLGKDNLQRHLLKQAESVIVAHANQVLDHISGGTLRLKLRNDNDYVDGSRKSRVIKALDLLAYNNQAGSAPLPVGMLSGSQRFRVAISLALGIGQYAGRASQRIESVIIDEGFGSLDHIGRQEMIEELHALRSVLKRIILVSHEEEFTRAFQNRYHIELTGGSSRVNLYGPGSN
jgi:DNA repair exonuclease SbcCD ATPase subunit